MMMALAGCGGHFVCEYETRSEMIEEIMKEIELNEAKESKTQ